ncbi:MAG: phosphoenolpyruvate carboxykinase (ATP) [Chloroflexi bacterium]|nr:phosphoenolpyruvate carboxykinase (ATP) [Chloroflexota bacterium]
MLNTLTQWLEKLGIVHQGEIFLNPDKAQLVTHAILNREGQLTSDGALAVVTTPYTGRSPNDKYIVDDKRVADLWWGDVNRPVSREQFDNLQARITAYLSNRNLYIIDAFVGADPDYRLSIRVVTEFAWQALAAQSLFIYTGETHPNDPDITVIAAPDFSTHPEIDGVRSNAAILLDVKEKVVLIAASKYVGEIKKSAFTLMNAYLPPLGVLPMHCSANIGDQGDVALYFGLSGTGKTTLSSTADRKLIGDDEHGWTNNGIFNFEGGCYAKTIRLKPELEPVIWQAVHQFGTVLENVVISPETQVVDFDSAQITENTRAAYPLTRVDNIIPEAVSGHPSNIFFLTADAFGVMPPIAKLHEGQILYYFLSGYTSKVAGTERGLGQKPQATFSTGFAEPFLPLTPDVYANLVKEKIAKHGTNTWLVNTGWTGGDFNTGYRMPLRYTRHMINWILSGAHQSSTYHQDPFFNLSVPDQIDGIPEELLYPQRTWKDQKEFEQVAKDLRLAFEENFKKFESFLTIDH